MAITDSQLNLTPVEDGSKIPLKGTKQHQDLLRKVETDFSSARSTRLQFEQQWYLNIAFYFGKHYVQWSSSQGQTARLFVPKAPPWRVRLTVNQVRKYIRKEHAKATQEQPTGFVLPASSDDDDLMSARAGDAIIEHLWREMKARKELKRAAFWASLCGTSFIKDWYKEVKVNEEQSRPAVSAISPFHIWVPNIAEEELENQEVVFQGMSKDRSWVKNTYNKELPSDGSYGEGMLEDKFLQAMGIIEKPKQAIYVKEAWYKPGSYFKDGATVVWAGDEILHFEDGYPYSHNEFPFSKIDHIPTGRFYGESIITDLIPIQKEYNRTRSQIIEAKNRTAKPQLAATQGSIDANKITSEPGLIVFYKPGYQAPTPIPLQGLPNYVLEELNRDIADMDDISSQHEVSRGQAPPGVEAATAISYLQEQDDSVLSNLVGSIEDACEKIGRHSLWYVNHYWDVEHKIKVVGYDRQFEVFQFSKANLNGNTDYVVQSGSGTPRSQAAKQAFIMSLMESGYIPPALGLKYLEMSETGRLYEEMHIDARQAQRENVKMSLWVQPAPVEPQLSEEEQLMIEAGLMEPPAPPQQDPNEMGIPPVNTWDNHIAHIMEHDQYRKRQEFEQLPPENKMLFEQHVQTHKLMMMVNVGMVPANDPATQINAAAYQIMNGLPVGGAVAAEESQPEQEQQQQMA